MPWKEVGPDKLAKILEVNETEIREKQHLIAMIVEVRKKKGLSQAALAKKVGVSQGRIAQIESSIGTRNISFDILFGILLQLGYDFRIVYQKVA